MLILDASMNSIESPSVEYDPSIHVEIEPEYEAFVPELFRQQPVEYFEALGRNIKPGEIKKDADGVVREDPTAVKELPVWTDGNGKELHTVAKRINEGKGEVPASGNPYYEYELIKLVNSLDLPAPALVARGEQRGVHMFVMKKIEGVSWYDKDQLALKERGYSDEEILGLYQQAEQMMEAMQREFEEAGIVRGWKLKDMIFDIDFETKKIRSMVPTDWERTKVDAIKLEAYKQKRSG